MERGRSKERRRKKGSTCSAAQPAYSACQRNATQHFFRPSYSLTPWPPSTRFGSPFHGGDGRLFLSFPIPPPFVLCKSKGAALQFPNQGKLGTKTNGRKQGRQFLQQTQHSLCKSNFNITATRFLCWKELLQSLIVPATGIYHLNSGATAADSYLDFIYKRIEEQAVEN